MNTPVPIPAVTKKVPMTFTILLGVIFVAVLITYGITCQYYKEIRTVITPAGLSLFGDSQKAIAGVCCLIMDTVFTMLGFGLLLSAFRNQKWTGLAVALFVVSFNIIVGLLFQKMWFEIFFGFRRNFQNPDIGQYNVPTAYEFWNRQSWGGRPLPSYYSFRLSNLCSTSYLVGMTAYSGRVSINKLAISLPIFCILYYLNFYLNALICYSTANKQAAFVYLDAYGTILIYLFGGVYGIITGAITKLPIQQSSRWAKSRISLTFSLLGSLFLFATFCLSYTGILTGSFGAPENFRYNSAALLVMFGLIGGILANFSISFLLGKGVMNVQSIIMGTISGGIMVGGLVDVIQNIGACLFIGFVGGAIAAVFMNLVTPKMNQNGVMDSQGLIGPILVVAVIASFVIHPSVLHQFFVRSPSLYLRGVGYPQTDFRFARYHLTYFGLTVAFAAITGAILGFIYKAKTRENHFEDTKFFADDYGLYNGQFMNNNYPIPPQSSLNFTGPIPGQAGSYYPSQLIDSAVAQHVKQVTGSPIRNFDI